VERDELPRHDEDHGRDREHGVTQPVLHQQGDPQRGAETEVGIQQRLVGDGDRRRAQQQRGEEQHREHGSVAVRARDEHPDEDAQRGLHQPRQRHDQERDAERVHQAGVRQHRGPVLEPDRRDLADAVPAGEAQQEHPDQRDEPERREEHQRR
jgi:hypothetical protein